MVRLLMAHGASAREGVYPHREATTALAPIAEEGGGPVLPGASLGRDQLPGKLVQWLVLAEAVANPLVVVEDGFDADPVRIGAEQIGPFVGPVVGKLRVLATSSRR